MANSGSYETSHLAATSRKWYWAVSWWVSSWSGNTATISYEVYDRCESGTSGSTWVANYGFGGSIAGHDFDNVQDGNFYKDKKRAWGSFTIGGGSGISSSCWARPYASSNYYSDGSGSWTLDNNVTTPKVTVSLSSPEETTIKASMSVTDNGHASIVDNYIGLFTDSGCTQKVKTITGTSGTFTGLSPNKTYYARANASNGTYRGYSSVVSKTTYQYPYITGVTTANLVIGNEQKISLYNPLGREVTVYMKKDNTSGSELYNGKTKSTSFSFTPTASKLYSSIPDKNSANCVYYCVYSNQNLANKTGTYKVSGNNNQAPTFTTFDYTDVDSLAPQLTGKVGVNNPGVLIAGMSDCKFNITTSQKATSNYGATLDHYNFAWSNGSGKSANYSSSNAVTATVSDGNSTKLQVTAYDKRGQYKTAERTNITIISPVHASSSLSTTRKDGIGTITYLNGYISYWSGDWNNGSSRPNNLYKIEYTVDNGSAHYDITTAVKNNSSSSISNKITKMTLNSNTIQLHNNGSSGGFATGTAHTIKIFVTTGVTNSGTQYNYDNRRLVTTITVTSGKFGMTRFKDGNDNHHYAINGLPATDSTLLIHGDFRVAKVDKNSKGQGIFPYGIRGVHLGNGAGTSGYMKAMKITSFGTYQNQVISFDVRQRQRAGTIYIFPYGNNTSGAISVTKMFHDGNIGVQYTDTDNEIIIYISKSESYDDIEISNLQIGYYNRQLDIEWINQTVQSLPSGVKYAMSIGDALLWTNAQYRLSATTGWKRIGYMDGMAGGSVMVNNTASYGTMGRLNFASGDGWIGYIEKEFKVMTNDHYFTKARIVRKAGERSYLELYQHIAEARTLTLKLSQDSINTTLYQSETNGTVPDGWTSNETSFS